MWVHFYPSNMNTISRHDKERVLTGEGIYFLINILLIISDSLNTSYVLYVPKIPDTKNNQRSG
ncbi:MAG: hypothetical protein D3910_00270 [Candidatus Electrothrix sp. ATG2]|nr:hypothetical protein [Candidatus Electrothrix sp. ATG2]